MRRGEPWSSPRRAMPRPSGLWTRVPTTLLEAKNPAGPPLDRSTARTCLTVGQATRSGARGAAAPSRRPKPVRQSDRPGGAGSVEPPLDRSTARTCPTVRPARSSGVRGAAAPSRHQKPVRLSDRSGEARPRESPRHPGTRNLSDCRTCEEVRGQGVATPSGHQKPVRLSDRSEWPRHGAPASNGQWENLSDRLGERRKPVGQSVGLEHRSWGERSGQGNLSDCRTGWTSRGKPLGLSEQLGWPLGASAPAGLRKPVRLSDGLGRASQSCRTVGQVWMFRARGERLGWPGRMAYSVQCVHLRHAPRSAVDDASGASRTGRGMATGP